MALIKHLKVGATDYTFDASKLSDSTLAHSITVPTDGSNPIYDSDKLALLSDLDSLEAKVPVLSNGKIPNTYLPAYVDDVVEGYYSSSKFYSDSGKTTQITGETGKIYVDLSTNKTYRWSGSAYVEISASLALGETSSTAYRGDRGKTAYDHSQSEHAPVNAEENQNAFSNISAGGVTVAADNKTDTVTFEGSNITITGDATNDKVTFSVASGTTSAAGIVKLTNSTSSTSTTTAATPSSVKTAYDLASEAKTLAQAAQNTADGKSDSGHTHTITATATDGIFDLTGTSGTNKVTYSLAPYSASTATSTWIGTDGNAGKFYLGTNANPSKTTRLNYNGYLYATKLYSGGAEVSVSGHTHSYAASDHDHDAADITSGTFAIARIPTGTTSTTVSLGNHTHNYAGSSSAGGAANSVKTNLIVKLNGGTTEGTNLFTFNGSTAKTIDITPASIGAAASSHGTHVSFTTTTPKANGTAAVGTASTVSRSDHVHPLQTTVSGNAGTATKFASAQSVALTGDVTGSASSQAGWSIETTLADSGVTAGTYGPSANVTGNDGATISIPQITVDSKGRVTSITARTYTSKNTADTDTHWTTKLYATGSSGTANAATANGATYLRLFDNSTARSSINIKGTGATTVTSDANGVITINSTDTNTDTNYYHTRAYSTGLKLSTGTGVSDMYVPYATDSQYGVVKLAGSRSSAITTATGGTTSGRYYGVEKDSNGKLFVNVPWTDNNTIYTHPSYTATTGVPTANATPGFGGTFKVNQISSDGTGHVTANTARTITIPSTLSNGTSTAGLIKTTSTVTSSSGYTACPVISGVPYYKDTTCSVTNKAATLAWGTSTTIATVGGTNITAALPANPTLTWGTF